MKCGKCGKEIDNYAKKCPFCGAVQIIIWDENGNIVERPPQKEENIVDVKEKPEKDRLQTSKGFSGKKKNTIAKYLIVLALISAFGVFMYRAGSKKQPVENEAKPSETTAAMPSASETNQKSSITAGGPETKEETTEIQTPEELLRAEESDVPTEWENAAKPEVMSEPESETMDEILPKEHRYELVMGDFTWDEAYYNAIQRGGYLVHFDSDGEFEQVIQDLNLNTDSGRKIKIWIGGRRMPGSYDYKWINADGTYEASVLNSSDYWMNNEPSFRDTTLNLDEYYMDIFYYKSESRWVWNDAPEDIIAAISTYAGNVGYICEYEE